MNKGVDKLIALVIFALGTCCFVLIVPTMVPYCLGYPDIAEAVARYAFYLMDEGDKFWDGTYSQGE